MSDLERMSKQELKAILNETEQHIHEIRAELEKRDSDMQHEEVDDISLSPEWTPVQWGKVRTFFEMVLEELRK